MPRLFWIIAMLLALAPIASVAQPALPSPTVPTNETAAFDAAVTDMCGKRVVLLGEAAHGEGHTEAFKVALVQRLVKRCHFSAVFFEASHYDFIEIARRQRAREPVSADMVSSAIGGLWKFDREFQPLVPFLLRQLTARRLTLGGLDGQLGAFQSFYSNDAMPDELTRYLDGARAQRCRAVFRGLIYGFTGGDPEQADARPTLRGCVTEIGRAVAAKPTLTPTRRAELRQMLATIDRFMAADPNDDAGYFAARDRAMYLDFRWLADRLPRSAKIIVWAANVHVAKGPAYDPAFASTPNLGAFVRRDYGDRSFALGITAFGGSYRWNRKEYHDLPAPPPGSLEAGAMAVGDAGAAYLGPARLRRLGAVPGALGRHRYLTADWSKAFDGVVVLRTEYPPHSTRPGYF